MAKVKVRAKVDGVHAMTGLALRKGETYEVEEALAGAEVFEKVKEKKGGSGPPDKED